jgi:hypothetical protein
MIMMMLGLGSANRFSEAFAGFFGEKITGVWVTAGDCTCVGVCTDLMEQPLITAKRNSTTIDLMRYKFIFPSGTAKTDPIVANNSLER